MLWRRPRATLDDVVELLSGIGTMLMAIDAKLQIMLGDKGDDDGEAGS